MGEYNKILHLKPVRRADFLVVAVCDIFGIAGKILLVDTKDLE